MQTIQQQTSSLRVAQKLQRSARRSAAVVRASDEKPVASGAPRSKDTLYLGGIGASEQSLTYLNRQLPGDYGSVGDTGAVRSSCKAG
jgi:hypothetical protein